MVMRRVWHSGVLVGLMVMALVGLSETTQAAKPELKGNFQVLSDEKSTHKPGKVQLIEFADFYCPHCHRFDGEGLACVLQVDLPAEPQPQGRVAG